MKNEIKQTRKGYRFNATVTMTLINLLKKKVINDNNVHLDYHKPKHDTFILICNHTESFDPGYEMAALKRYVRFVSSDHVLRMKVSWLFTKIGGVIIKYRDKPSEIINEDIPGWLVANEGKLTVALEVEVTEELRREGIARELVNRIQNIRKSSGFEITDKINVTLTHNEQTDAAVEEYKQYICTQVQANELTLAEVTEGTELDFDDFKLVARVEKA